MDLGNDCQWLLASENKRQRDTMCPLTEVYPTTSETAWPQIKPEIYEVSISTAQVIGERMK